jgi:cytoskeletal protein RodZ
MCGCGGGRVESNNPFVEKTQKTQEEHASFSKQPQAKHNNQEPVNSAAVAVVFAVVGGLCLFLFLVLFFYSRRVQSSMAKASTEYISARG